jgi:hypothetical protein
MPAIIAAVVGVIASILIFSQPAIVQQTRDQKVQEINEGVKAGTITQAQADQTIQMLDKILTPSVLKTLGCVGAVFGSFVRLFWWAFILWLMALLLLKVRVEYLKLAEVVGMATMISVLGSIVALLLVVNLGKLFSGPSLALTVSDFNVQNKSHLMLGAANVFSFWFIGLLASGLSRLTGAPFARALFLVMSFWILQEMALIFSGLGQMAL